MNRTNQTISIELMRPIDLEAVQRIDRQCFPTPWFSAAYLTELSNRAACYLVARALVDGISEVIGYGGIWVLSGEAHITTLAVTPSFQGQKVAQRLLLALLEEALLQGAVRASLEVRERNRAARALYARFGFKEVALYKSYYSDTGENAVVMWADDLRGPEFQQQLRTVRARLCQKDQE